MADAPQLPAGSKKRNTAQDDHIMLRRERVASLRRRRMTQREIQITLATPYLNGNQPNPAFMLNPDTHQPYDLATINRDCKWLRAQDLKHAVEETKAHRGDILGELEELRRAAWGARDFKTVLGALKLKADITGTIVQKHEVSGADGGPIQVSVDDFTEIFQQMAAYEQQSKGKKKEVIPFPAANQ